jgi:CRP/FNR family transcriptional regulator, cyclic AMP receptor protein
MLGERGARMLAKGLDQYTVTYPGGTVLFREGEAGDRMYVIAEGKVRIVKALGTNEVTIAALAAGDCFGEMALLDKQPRSATAITSEEARLVIIDGVAFEQLIRENGEIAVRIMRKLSERLREANRYLLNFLATSNARRAVEVLRGSVRAEPAGYRPLPEAVNATWIAPRAGLSLVEAEEVWTRLRAAGIIIIAGGILSLAPESEVEEYLSYIDLQREYDPVTARELAEMTGLPEDEVHRIVRKVLMNRLGDESSHLKLADSYRKYLALKKRFEYHDRV